MEIIKVSAEKIVCSAEWAKVLTGLGVEAVCCNVYERDGDDWFFAGEYQMQDDVLPAWTMQELAVAIGSDYILPQLLDRRHYSKSVNMLQFFVAEDKKRHDFENGADACAFALSYLINHKEIKLADVNERLRCYASGKFYEFSLKQK